MEAAAMWNEMGEAMEMLRAEGEQVTATEIAALTGYSEKDAKRYIDYKLKMARLAVKVGRLMQKLGR